MSPCTSIKEATERGTALRTVRAMENGTHVSTEELRVAAAIAASNRDPKLAKRLLKIVEWREKKGIA